MNLMTRISAGAAIIGGMALPAAAQTGYQYPQPAYPYPQQGYAQQGGIAGIINQLLGGRYQNNDRTAITQCAAAAQQQATAQYQPRYQQGYGGYPQQYNQGYGMARVTAITAVERRRNGLRVTGTMDSGMGYAAQGYPQPYGNAYGQGYAGGDLTFRCNVDYRGVVTNVRVNRNRSMYRR